MELVTLDVNFKIIMLKYIKKEAYKFDEHLLMWHLLLLFRSQSELSQLLGSAAMCRVEGPLEVGFQKLVSVSPEGQT